MRRRGPRPSRAITSHVGRPGSSRRRGGAARPGASPARRPTKHGDNRCPRAWAQLRTAATAQVAARPRRAARAPVAPPTASYVRPPVRLRHAHSALKPRPQCVYITPQYAHATPQRTYAPPSARKLRLAPLRHAHNALTHALSDYATPTTRLTPRPQCALATPLRGQQCRNPTHTSPGPKACMSVKRF